MGIICVADMELRSAARRSATHRDRWLAVGGFLLLFGWMLWAFDAFTNSGVAPRMFSWLASVCFIYCLIANTLRAADCLSSEKRDGTLGLLFLSNLNSAEIVGGKVIMHGLAGICEVLAIAPLLAMPLLMGGIPFGDYWRTVFCLVATTGFALACGVLASALCRRQFHASALALGLSLVLGLGAAVLVEVLRSLNSLSPWITSTARCSPLGLLWAVQVRPTISAGFSYPLGLAIVFLETLVLVLMAAWWLSRNWRDQGGATKSRARLQRRKGGLEFRQRLLSINPFFWLANRQRVSNPGFLIIVTAGLFIAARYLAGYVGAGFPGPAGGLGGHLMVWVLSALALGAFSIYYAASLAARRLAEEKQMGSIELLLTTPRAERLLGRGLWLAYLRQLLAPTLILTAVFVFLLWQVTTLILFDPPEPLPPGTTPSSLILQAFGFSNGNTGPMGWLTDFMLRLMASVYLGFLSTWLALGWVARWLGVIMKRPMLAPLAAVATVLAPPILLFAAACWIADTIGLDHLPERHFGPIMLLVANAITLTHLIAVSCFASKRWLPGLRGSAPAESTAGRPDQRRRWPLTFAWRVAQAVAVAALLVGSFYAVSNFNSNRRWERFLSETQRTGRVLVLRTILTPPPADSDNFARTGAFAQLLQSKSKTQKEFDAIVDSASLPRWSAAPWAPWISQKHSEFPGQVINPNAAASVNQELRAEAASRFLGTIISLEDWLSEVASQSNRTRFSVRANRDEQSVLDPELSENLRLEQLHSLVVLRACARLTLDDPVRAAEDLIVALRLALMARDCNDLRGTIRAQRMLVASLQPLWEGLSNRAWQEPELAHFQQILGRFSVLADHARALDRMALAHYTLWMRIHAASAADRELLALAGNFFQSSSTANRLRPAGWILDDCIQVLQLADLIKATVDIAGGRIDISNSWNGMHGLPLQPGGYELVQQMYWMGPSPGLTAYAQTAQQQAILACALERHWLQRKSYAASASELVPEFMDQVPRDAVTGRALALEMQTRYTLRGVGPNGRDDRQAKSSDDWLWGYPALRIETETTTGSESR